MFCYELIKFKIYFHLKFIDKSKEIYIVFLGTSGSLLYLKIFPYHDKSCSASLNETVQTSCRGVSNLCRVREFHVQMLPPRPCQCWAATESVLSSFFVHLQESTLCIGLGKKFFRFYSKCFIYSKWFVCSLWKCLHSN